MSQTPTQAPAHPIPLTTADGQQVWIVQPQWPAPSSVKALFTTRQGGVSQAPWHSWNMGEFVGDVPEHVQANRGLLQASITALSNHANHTQPVYLKQVHGCEVAPLDHNTRQAQANGAALTHADAAISTESGVACTIMVGDCLPVLFAHKRAPVVAAAHAGWRGLAGVDGTGVLEAAFTQFKREVKKWYQRQSQTLTDHELAQECLAWLGPCIGPSTFEVGDEVRAAFMAAPTTGTAPWNQADIEAYFLPHPQQRTGHWMANLSGLARLRLQHMGLQRLYGNDGSIGWCTVTNTEWYYSHRRDAQVLGTTGRMAACIWLDLPQ